MSSHTPSPDPLIHSSLDDFLRTLPPLASNPTEEQTAFLAQFAEEFGAVSSQSLLDTANYYLKFGRPPIVPSDPTGVPAKREDAVTEVDMEESDISWAMGTAAPAPTAPTPEPQSTQPPPHLLSPELHFTPHWDDLASNEAPFRSASVANSDIYDSEAEHSAGDNFPGPHQEEFDLMPAAIPGVVGHAVDENTGFDEVQILENVTRSADALESRPILKPIQAHSSNLAPLCRTSSTEVPEHELGAVTPTLPSQSGTVTMGEGSFSGVSAGKRKASFDAPEASNKKLKQDNYCPYCKKYFEKDLKKHIANNSKCNNSDKLAIYNGKGSLVPHASCNLHLYAARKPSTSALNSSSECMVLIPAAVAPGGELRQDNHSPYVHMQFGAPHQ